MVVPSPQAEKKRIRSAVRQERMRFVAALESETKRALEEQLAELLCPYIEKATIIGSYAPIGSEISPVPTQTRARQLGKTLAFPHFEHGTEQFTFRAGDALSPGPYGILQPCDRDPVVEPDLVLVPLVAVGDHGVRLGQGKGHYDRALTSLKKAGVTLLGIGWKVQRVETIPSEPWDIAVDLFASPRGVEDFRDA